MNQWRKSSFSDGAGGSNECVEVARPHDAPVGIRDSKSPDTGHLHVPASAFAAFTRTLK
ncbi:hypothetical protein ALI144C_28515 [Actinosynnema sp. ALI-1.44]|uniref:DUF397 domain-containing protein n=1 Tax=Actinosynnema sp. ALI-1.44 TaxID=1933779 RepID=UPI00097CBCBD|nr:DUF397 domain-containing protein [Actinosynnema sp. ALI-1.44]ONI78732.1 hypothetical protein ALI144C_28515 [Actinosynnema sp. ALI-1.44]